MPCALTVPEKALVYIAIVCNSLLLLIPGLASTEPDVLFKGPSLPAVKVLTEVLLIKSGYAPSNISKVPDAL